MSVLVTAGGADGTQDSTRIRPRVIAGIVYDTLSGKPIPFAIVRVADTAISTLTNRAGRYFLTVPHGARELQFRQIGYRMSSLRLDTVADTLDHDVYMRPLPVELAEIRATAEGESFAHELIRRAIARKNDLLSRIHDYRYDAYVKFVVRDLGKHQDSTESIVLITETQTTAYWEQPGKYQERITARQQSTNLNADNNLVSVGEIVNFNRNRIDLEKYAVVSPTADDALDHYDYFLVDSLVIRGLDVYRLAVQPKSNVNPLFVGMIDIADSTFDVVSIDVGANEAIRFDFFSNLRYRQRLRDHGNDHWMPAEIQFSGELHVGVPIPGFPEHVSFAHTASLSNFRFDEGNAPRTLGEFIVVVDERADDADSASWGERRAQPLSDVEQHAYARIDSLQTIPQPFAERLLSGTLGLLFLSTNEDFFHFNRVEGLYLGAGVTLRDLSPDVIVRAKTGYAFGRDAWEYRFGAQYRISESQRLWLGASYHEEMVSRTAAVSGAYNPTHVALLAKVDPLDYYRQTGFTVTLSTRLFNFTRLAVQYNDVRQRSAPVVSDFSFFEKDKILRGNPPIVDGRMRSISGSFTFDTRPLLKRKGRDFFINTLTRTELTIGAEYANPDLIPNDFDFVRYYVRLYRRQRTLNLGLTSINAVVGASSRALPPQRYFTIDFGRGVFLQGDGFNTLSDNNFSGNRVAMLFVNHDFGHHLFRKSRIPLIRDLPVTLSMHGGVFWTDFVDHQPNPGDDEVLTAPTPYSEIGFGIGNLTPMLSPFNFAIWFTWQLSSYPTRGFGFRIGVPGQ